MDLSENATVEAAALAGLVQAGEATLMGRINALLASDIGKRDWPLTLYSRERLFSIAARRELVMPDLGKWPAAEGTAPRT